MFPEIEHQSKTPFEEFYERYLKARTVEEMERAVAEYAEVVYSEEELQMREGT